MSKHEEEYYINWDTFEMMACKLAKMIKESGIPFTSVYGEPRGGLILAVRLSHLLNLPLKFEWNLEKDTLLVDDIVDTGRTLDGMNEAWRIASLYWNPSANFKPDFYIAIKPSRIWVNFPWETKLKELL